MEEFRKSLIVVANSSTTDMKVIETPGQNISKEQHPQDAR